MNGNSELIGAVLGPSAKWILRAGGRRSSAKRALTAKGAGTRSATTHQLHLPLSSRGDIGKAGCAQSSPDFHIGATKSKSTKRLSTIRRKDVGAMSADPTGSPDRQGAIIQQGERRLLKCSLRAVTGAVMEKDLLGGSRSQHPQGRRRSFSRLVTPGHTRRSSSRAGGG